MADYLPEHTVDAWTAIALATLEPSGIWLPPASTQSVIRTAPGEDGTPWDVELTVPSKALIIENKSLNATQVGGSTIWFAQLEVLLHLGSLRGPANQRYFPWVYYGLPRWSTGEVERGPAPTDWQEFPEWQGMVPPWIVRNLLIASSPVYRAWRTKLEQLVAASGWSAMEVVRRPYDEVYDAVHTEVDWAISSEAIKVFHDAGGTLRQATHAGLTPTLAELLVAIAACTVGVRVAEGQTIRQRMQALAPGSFPVEMPNVDAPHLAAPGLPVNPPRQAGQADAAVALPVLGEDGNMTRFFARTVTTTLPAEG